MDYYASLFYYFCMILSYQIYYQDDILLDLFGEERYPIKRLLLTRNLSSDYYDVCVPVNQDVNTAIISPDKAQVFEEI